MALSSLHLAGVVDVCAGAGSAVDWVARYALALQLIDRAERTQVISSRVRAIEARAFAASIAPAIGRSCWG